MSIAAYNAVCDLIRHVEKQCAPTECIVCEVPTPGPVVRLFLREVEYASEDEVTLKGVDGSGHQHIVIMKHKDVQPQRSPVMPTSIKGPGTLGMRVLFQPHPEADGS